MGANTFGKIFSLSTFGESHGIAIGGIIDGVPPGFCISEDIIKIDMDRRKTGSSKFVSQRKEHDNVKLLSGIIDGKTLGTPIGFIIENTNQKPKDYDDIKDKFRPSHGDYVYQKKYGIRDCKGGGRASARETACRVVAGSIAKQILGQILNKNTFEIIGYISQIGNIKPNSLNLSHVKDNEFSFPDLLEIDNIRNLIEEIRREGDSIGSRVSVIAKNVPIGLGEPIYDKLSANIAKAMMSINAVKAVEIGDGISCVSEKGSDFRDLICQSGFLSNHAGGIDAGISNGQDIVVHVSFKPAASILKPGRTIDVDGNETTISTKGRHDPCVGLRAVVIVESMLAMVLLDSLLLANSINFD